MDYDNNNVILGKFTTPSEHHPKKSWRKQIFKPKEFFGELLGTFILTIVTKGAVISLAVAVFNNEMTVSSAHLPSCLASGLAVMMAILVTGGASGAQTNPAVSVTMWAAGKLHWTDLPAYLAGQYLGAGIGAAIILLNFRENLEGVGAASVTSFPDLAQNVFHLIFDQFLATFLLLSCILSVDDQGHSPAGLLVGLSVAGIGLAIGRNAGASMNPALDFMPRLVAALWDSIEKQELDTDPFTRGGFFWLVPFIVPYFGGLFALFVYKMAIVRSRKWDNRTTSAADETRKGENGVSNPAFVPDMTYAHAADISYEAPDHRFPHGHEFGPDPKKCTHFDGSICHRMAVMY